MAQPQDARITCSQCNSFYASESELREHEQESHRRTVPEQGTFRHGGAQLGVEENWFGTSKEGWANLSVRLRNHVQVQFKLEELGAIDRFILLASQGSVFDEVCRRM